MRKVVCLLLAFSMLPGVAFAKDEYVEFKLDREGRV